MKTFHITPLDESLRAPLQEKIDNLTKPKGSLGVLKSLALQLGMIQRSLSPSLQNPHHIVFGADHGIVAEGVSPSPKEVTLMMMLNFAAGGAGVNFLARQHGIKLMLVDAGIDADLSGADSEGIINMKIRRGTLVAIVSHGVVLKTLIHLVTQQPWSTIAIPENCQPHILEL